MRPEPWEMLTTKDWTQEDEPGNQAEKGQKEPGRHGFKAPVINTVKCCERQIGPGLKFLVRAMERSQLTLDKPRQWSGESRRQIVVVRREQMRKSRETACVNLL